MGLFTYFFRDSQGRDTGYLQAVLGSEWDNFDRELEDTLKKFVPAAPCRGQTKLSDIFETETIINALYAAPNIRVKNRDEYAEESAALAAFSAYGNEIASQQNMVFIWGTLSWIAFLVGSYYLYLGWNYMQNFKHTV